MGKALFNDLAARVKLVPFPFVEKSAPSYRSGEPLRHPKSNKLTAQAKSYGELRKNL